MFSNRKIKVSEFWAHVIMLGIFGPSFYIVLKSPNATEGQKLIGYLSIAMVVGYFAIRGSIFIVKRSPKLKMFLGIIAILGFFSLLIWGIFSGVSGIISGLSTAPPWVTALLVVWLIRNNFKENNSTPKNEQFFIPPSIDPATPPSNLKSVEPEKKLAVQKLENFQIPSVEEMDKKIALWKLKNVVKAVRDQKAQELELFGKYGPKQNR